MDIIIKVDRAYSGFGHKSLVFKWLYGLVGIGVQYADSHFYFIGLPSFLHLIKKNGKFSLISVISNNPALLNSSFIDGLS